LAEKEVSEEVLVAVVAVAEDVVVAEDVAIAVVVAVTRTRSGCP